MRLTQFGGNFQCLHFDNKGDVTRDDSQRLPFSVTQRCNIAATLFRIVTTLFQYCDAVLR